MSNLFENTNGNTFKLSDAKLPPIHNKLFPLNTIVHINNKKTKISIEWNNMDNTFVVNIPELSKPPFNINDHQLTISDNPQKAENTFNFINNKLKTKNFPNLNTLFIILKKYINKL